VCDIVVRMFTFAIPSPDEFLPSLLDDMSAFIALTTITETAQTATYLNTLTPFAYVKIAAVMW